MRIDSFFASFFILFFSLLVLLISDNTLICNIAYFTALLSMALFTVDDWFDELFIKLAHLLFSLSKHPSAPKQPLVHTKIAAPLVFNTPLRPLKARQRWLRTYAGHGIRWIMNHQRNLH